MDGDFNDSSTWKAAQTDCKRIVSGSLRACVRQCKRQVENLMKKGRTRQEAEEDRQGRNHNEGNLTSNVGTGFPHGALRGCWWSLGLIGPLCPNPEGKAGL